jgi:hypothetical protein
MVPDFDRADPRYHDGSKCGHPIIALVDGADPGYTNGIFEGPEGWVLSAAHGYDAEQLHQCPNCTTYDADGCIEHAAVCVEPLFGAVTVEHLVPDLGPLAESIRRQSSVRSQPQAILCHSTREARG